MNERLWVIDDVPSRRFPIYCRGNTGEVYPNVITPLCGSIVQAPIARGQEQVFLEIGAAVPSDLTEQQCAVLTGCFGGYLYGNLSIGRLMGARAPGMKPQDVDQQLFGTNDAPPYRRQKGDRNLRASARLMRFMLGTLKRPDFSWLQHERSETHAWVAAQPQPASASNEELFATVQAGAERFAPLMRSLLLASASNGGPAAIVDRLAARVDVELKAKTAVGVGGVESAEPARELWRLARLDADGSDAERFRADFDAFLATYGARGPDEWELASHTWGTNPEIALAAIDRIRRSRAPNPCDVLEQLARDRTEAIEAVARSIPRPVRRMFRRAARAVGDGAGAREFAKGTIIQSAYAVRLALFELVRRAQDNGAPEERRDCWLVTIDELPQFVDRPHDLSEVIAERGERRDYLQARVPPFVFEGQIPDPATWPRRDAPAEGIRFAGPGDVLEGMGVAPGRAEGRARVVRDPSDPSALEAGDVLVAPITDPAWTPLFLVASAVVVNVGAQMSHAAIVARELGIPAVVSVEGATERISDGATLDVDGARGVVRVVSV